MLTEAGMMRMEDGNSQQVVGGPFYGKFDSKT
jgi:hypothetical protein